MGSSISSRMLSAGIADPPQQGVGLQPGAAAGARIRCTSGSATAARGCASCRPWSRARRRSAVRRTRRSWSTRPRPRPPRRVRLRQFAPRRVERDVALAREAQQIGLAFLVGLRLPGLDRALPAAQGVVGDDQPIIDADAAAEAPAGLAGAERGIEAERARARVLVQDVAVRRSAARSKSARAARRARFGRAGRRPAGPWPTLAAPPRSRRRRAPARPPTAEAILHRPAGFAALLVDARIALAGRAAR